jgi:hypothetical protein
LNVSDGPHLGKPLQYDFLGSIRTDLPMRPAGAQLKSAENHYANSLRQRVPSVRRVIGYTYGAGRTVGVVERNWRYANRICRYSLCLDAGSS